jgi:prevent-host-death family protein
MMEPEVIPESELRKKMAQVLRDAEAGQTFVVTVQGRPVATLGPAPVERRVDVDAATVARILATPIDAEHFAAELDAAEAPVT